MLYYLFTYLDKLDVPGAGLFNFITFRAGITILTSLFLSFFFGKKIITFLRKKQIGETIRELGLQGEQSKKGTPTMGGIIIIFSTLIPVLLFAKLDNVYIILMVLTTIWLGLLGFMDDYVKVFKKNKEGIKGRFKIIAQLGLGIIVGLTVVFSKDIVIRETFKIPITTEDNKTEVVEIQQDIKSFKTTLPFFKHNEIDYSKILDFWPDRPKAADIILYLAIIIFIIMAVSNGVNLTDGLDGLAAGTTSTALGTLGVFAYVSGNVVLANYLMIMYIPNLGELVIFISALMGALIGFLWYNSYPAQVFMGDTGSLTLGGLLAVISILVRKEWLLPVFGGIFLAESLSVIIQVSYFKYTKRKYGEGRRIFLMSPLHHHYQKKGIPEPKIVARFIIVSFMLAVLSIITLKIR